MKNQNIHTGHRKRLREQINKNGIINLSDLNYLENLLTFSIPRADTNPIAHNLLREFKNLDNIFRADYARLINVDGVGEHTASFIATLGALDFYRRKSRMGDHKQLNCLSESIKFIKSVMPDSNNEQFIVISLKKNLKVDNYKVFKGLSHSKISLDVNEIINYLISHSTGFFMFAHTHPNHNAKPSQSDIKQFESFLNLANYLSFQIIDNLILGENDFYSYKLSKLFTYDEVDIDYIKDRTIDLKRELQYKQREEFLSNQKEMLKFAYDDNYNPNLNLPEFQTSTTENNIKSIAKQSIKTNNKINKKQEKNTSLKPKEKNKNQIWQPVDDANGKVKKQENKNTFTMEDFKEKYKEKPKFKNIEEQKEWIRQYCEDFEKVNKK